jgi:hypothetical protein
MKKNVRRVNERKTERLKATVPFLSDDAVRSPILYFFARQRSSDTDTRSTGQIQTRSVPKHQQFPRRFGAHEPQAHNLTEARPRVTARQPYMGFADGDAGTAAPE